MNGTNDIHTNSDRDPSSIESIIRGAGNYLVVSDDLRPQTIEAALEAERAAVSGRRIRFAALAVALLLAILVPMFRTTEDRGIHSSSPSAAEIHQAALRYAAEANITPDWALQKVFDDLRRSHAQRLGQALR